MERGRQSGSSLASNLFGAKDSSASSAGTFGSIFPPPPKAVGQESLHLSETQKKTDPGHHAWTAKTEVSDKNAVGGEGQNHGPSKDFNSYYQEQRVLPFHYSSSIYYGGQDDYSLPQEAPSPVFTTFNKDGGEDDSGGASRGNWWQGSLYY